MRVDVDNKTRQRIEKLYALMMMGVGGEQETAERMFHEMCQKHDLTIRDFKDDVTRKVRFYYKTSYDKTIISQTLYKILSGTERKVYSCSHPHRRVSADLTKSEAAVADQMVAFHRRQWKIEKNRVLEDLALAYIHKHNLFPSECDGDEGSDSNIDFGRTNRILVMMGYLSDSKFNKQLNQNNE